MHETDKELTVHAELPGVDKQDIQVNVQGNVLSIAAESKKDDTRDDKGWRVRERSYGKYERRLMLPKGVDSDAIAANYQDGVLELVIAKKQEPKHEKKAVTIN